MLPPNAFVAIFPVMTGPTRLSPMERALQQAHAAAERGEVPIGAVIVGPDGTVLAEAARLGAPRLVECDLYVTLEPCPMCAQAISFARIRRLYYGAPDPKGGGVEHGPRIFNQPTCHHCPEVYSGIAEQEAAELLRGFFKER